MPLFEFECRGCGERFEAFVTTDRKPACPACQGAELRKLLSSPGLVGGSFAEARRAEAEAIPACRAQGGHCTCTRSDN
jgi:putative FmdB family regulatory protein